MLLDLMTLTLVAKPLSEEEGMRILERDKFRCQYCGLDMMANFENAMAMSVDFVIPRARKGRKVPDNLVACCRPCNTLKGTRAYKSFADAKAYVLAKREELHKVWESKRGKLHAGAGR